MPAMTPMTSCMEAVTSPIRPVILAVASLVRAAMSEISVATTEKPLPAAPARAASMLAFSASILVWAVMPPISSTMVCIFSI